MRAICAVLLLVASVIPVANSAVGDERVRDVVRPAAPIRFAILRKPLPPPVAPADVRVLPSFPRRPTQGLRPSAPPPPNPARQPAVDAEIDSSKFALQLTDGTRLIGVPSNSDVVMLEVAFGRIEIPLQLLASVKFSASQQQSHVRFKNGDTLTGRVVLEKLNFETAYGVLTIPVDMLAVMTAGTKFPNSVARATTKVLHTNSLMMTVTPRIIIQEDNEQVFSFYVGLTR